MTEPFSSQDACQNRTYRTHRTYGTHGTFIWVLLLIVSAGCARLGERVEFVGTMRGAPRPADILAALAANDEAVQSFRAAGSFKLESPEFEAVKVFKDGAIAFRRPADLSVKGRNALGMEMFRLTSVGSEFLIDFPASRDKPYYRVEGEQFASVPFSVSPSDIAREMFLPENWDELKRREVRLVQYDAQTQTAILEIGPRNAPRRRVTVMGPPWVVIKNERMEDGQVVAVTTKNDYRDDGGIRFPAFIDAWFPVEQTRLTFEMRKISTNVEIDKSLFDIKARARTVGIYLQ